MTCILTNIEYGQALVDAPDMVRGQMNFKRLSLTDIKIDIPRIPKKKTLIAAMEAADTKYFLNLNSCCPVIVITYECVFL